MSRISTCANAPPLPGWISSRFSTTQSLPFCSSTLPGLMSMALIFMARNPACRGPLFDGKRLFPISKAPAWASLLGLMVKRGAAAHFRVAQGPEQGGVGADIEPHQQHDHRADRAIGLIV